MSLSELNLISVIKKCFVIFCSFFFTINYGFSQVIFSDDFQSGSSNWTLNSGGNGDNVWIVNNSYTGILFSSTPSQPGAIVASPNSNYLHITNQTICGFGFDCQAVFDAGSATDRFATMVNNVSTAGLSGVSIDFYYLCNGAAGNSYGNVEYSIDNGTTWLAASPNYSGISSWTLATISNPAWDNQAQLKFRFRWRNNSLGNDPSFAVDDFKISHVVSGNTLVTGTINGSPFCPCETISVPFTTTGSFPPGTNDYNVILSDANGVFNASAVAIGSLTSTLFSGTITATIPCNTPPGSGYRIRVVSSSLGLIGSDNGINLIVNASPATPTASITSQPTCSNPTGTIIVTAPSGATIQYSVGGAYQTSGTFSGLAANTYNVTALDAATGCTSIATVLIINIPPGAPATPTATVTVQPSCTNATGTIVITSPAGASIQYSIGGAYQSSGTFSGLAPGNYTITAQDISSGCTSASTTLTVNPIPVPPNTPTASVTIQPTCSIPTGTIVVTAPSGATIQYSIGGAYQSIGTFSGLAPGTYTITAQDISYGCISTSTTLTVNPIPVPPNTPTASVTIQPTCSTPTGTIVVTAPSGATIQYSIGGAYQSSGTFSGLTPGNYTITAQDISTGCISSSINLTVNPAAGAPVISLDNQINATCFSSSDGSATVSATGGAAPYSYLWSPGGGTNPTASNLSAGSYTVTVTDNAGCASTQSVTIVSPSQLISGSVVTNVNCSAATGGQIATSASGGSGNYSYAWSPGNETASALLDLEVGAYTLLITDANGCSITENYTIGANGSLPIVATPSSAFIAQGQSVQLNATGGNDYTWSPSATLSCSDCANPNATPIESTIYTVVGTSEYGCTGSYQVLINVELDCGEIFVPTAFSPNSDNLNDRLVVCGLDNGCVKELKFEVYDRWGQRVFETEDPQNHWDGSYKGRELNTAVFVFKLYVLKWNNEIIESSGNISLTR
jgi:gliding motility-associated-like protein